CRVAVPPLQTIAALTTPRAGPESLLRRWLPSRLVRRPPAWPTTAPQACSLGRDHRRATCRASRPGSHCRRSCRTVGCTTAVLQATFLQNHAGRSPVPFRLATRAARPRRPSRRQRFYLLLVSGN